LKSVTSNLMMVLDAVDLCARTGRPIPMWAVGPFCSRYQDWLHFRTKTLDAAFKVDRPKGLHFDTAAYRERMRPSVVRRVLHLQRPDGKTESVPLNGALFRRAGKMLGVSGSLVRTIWYEPASIPLIRTFIALQSITKA
jgi:hypothetical protein